MSGSETFMPIALCVPSEIWLHIFRLTRNKEESPPWDVQPRSDYVLICKRLKAPALTSLYEKVTIQFNNTDETSEWAVENDWLQPFNKANFVKFFEGTQHFHLVRQLNITSDMTSWIDCEDEIDSTDEDVIYESQLEAWQATEIAVYINLVLRLARNITSLEIDFHRLRNAAPAILAEITAQITSTSELKRLKLYAPQSDWFFDVLSKLNKNTKVTVTNPVGGARMANGVTFALRSVSIIWTTDTFSRVMALIQRLVLQGRFEHLRIFYDRSFQPWIEVAELAWICQHALSLRDLELRVIIAQAAHGTIADPEFELEETQNLRHLTFAPLANLTALLVTDFGTIFHLTAARFPPALRHLTHQGYAGPLETVMAALADENWLPNLETFDFSWSTVHRNIRDTESPKWLDESQLARLSSERLDFFDSVAYGRPLSVLAQIAKELCSIRAIYQRDPKRFSERNIQHL